MGNIFVKRNVFCPIFVYCLHAKIGSFSRFWMWNNFFSINCSFFAVKCDWNSKISRNVQFLFFSKKTWFSFKIAECSTFTLAWVPNGINCQNCPFRPYYQVLLAKNQKKIERWKICKIWCRKSVFWGENVFLFGNYIFTKMERRTKCRW